MSLPRRRSIDALDTETNKKKKKKIKEREKKRRKKTEVGVASFTSAKIRRVVAIIFDSVPTAGGNRRKSIRSGGNVNYVSKGRNVLIRSGLSDLHHEVRGTAGKWS